MWTVIVWMLEWRIMSSEIGSDDLFGRNLHITRSEYSQQ